jgi:hypothetical protein
MPITPPTAENQVFLFCRATVRGTEQFSIWEHDALVWYAERQNYRVRRQFVFLAAVLVATILIALSAVPSFFFPVAIRTMFSFLAPFSWVGIAAGILSFFLLPILCYGEEHITVYRDASKSETVLSITQQTRFKLLQEIHHIVDKQNLPIAMLQRSIVFTQFARAWKCVTLQGQLLGSIKQRSEIDRIIGQPAQIQAPFVLYTSQGQLAGTFDYTILDLRDDLNHDLDQQIALSLALIINAEYSSNIADLTRQEWLRIQESKAVESNLLETILHVAAQPAHAADRFAREIVLFWRFRTQRACGG